MNLPEIELRVEDLLKSGIQGVALVQDPAIQQAFIAFKEQKKEKEIVLFFSDEERIVTGPLLIPEQRIYRRDPTGFEFNVFFTAAEIKRVMKAIGLQGVTLRNVNSEHNDPLEGVSVYEMWVSSKTDKSQSLGYDLPEGTLFLSLHVTNDQVWKDIKAGVYTGFSMEGAFTWDKHLIADVQNQKCALQESDMKVLGIDLSVGKKTETVAPEIKEEVKAEVKLAEDAPAADNSGPSPEDLKAIVDAINSIGAKVDQLVQDVEALKANSASASEGFKAELAKQNEVIAKLSAQPEGEIAGQEKKVALRSSTPLAEAFLAKLKKESK